MKTILLGIDGTGDLFMNTYRHEYQNSFVNKICRESRAEVKKYLRGPALEGFDTGIISSEGHNFVRLAKFANPTALVVLTGWSRGAACVISVANRLKDDDIGVDGMMLFDAVERTIATFGVTYVPNNVKRLVHAKRDPGAFSHPSFGNCAKYWQHPTQCDQRSFFCTHSALGGIPSRPGPGVSSASFIYELPEVATSMVTYNMDSVGSMEVWSWAAPRLRTMGFFP